MEMRKISRTTFWFILGTFLSLLFLPGGALGTEMSNPGTMLAGKLSDIASNPAYIWIEVGKNEVERFSWLLGETVFLDAGQNEIPPGEFLERFRGQPVFVLFEKAEKRAVAIRFVEN